MAEARKILLVDDAKSTAQHLRQVIEGLSGYEVVGHARNGAEAVKMYTELKPDIVCMDIVMPLMDGLQATRTILQHDANAKIVMISSVGGVREKVVEALRLGAKSVIQKPFEADKIEALFEGLFG